MYGSLRDLSAFAVVMEMPMTKKLLHLGRPHLHDHLLGDLLD